MTKDKQERAAIVAPDADLTGDQRAMLRSFERARLFTEYDSDADWRVSGELVKLGYLGYRHIHTMCINHFLTLLGEEARARLIEAPTPPPPQTRPR